MLAPVEKPTVMLVSATNDVASVERDRQRKHLNGAYWNGLVLTVGLIVCGFVLVMMLMRRNRSIHRLAHSDHLTGLSNRLVFQARLAALVAGSERRATRRDAARRRFRSSTSTMAWVMRPGTHCCRSWRAG